MIDRRVWPRPRRGLAPLKCGATRGDEGVSPLLQHTLLIKKKKKGRHKHTHLAITAAITSTDLLHLTPVYAAAPKNLTATPPDIQREQNPRFLLTVLTPRRLIGLKPEEPGRLSAASDTSHLAVITHICSTVMKQHKYLFPVFDLQSVFSFNRQQNCALRPGNSSILCRDAPHFIYQRAAAALHLGNGDLWN